MLLSNVSWTGGAGTLNWGDANNWSNNAIPGSGDDVTISKVGIGTITLGASSFEVRSLNDTTAVLSIASGGSLSLAAVAATSTFGQNITVQPGAMLAVGAGASVLLQGGQILTVNGAMTLASGDTLTLSTNYPGNTQVVVNGTLTATTTTFNLAGNGYGGDVLTVNSGGRLVASGSTFALNQVTLNAGSVFNPGDLSGDTFNGPLYLPITDVPLLSAAGGGSDNKSFQDIDILAGTLGTGTVNLNAIGTVSTASLRYVFPGNFTVAAGATLNVGPTVPVLLQGGQILTVNGAMTLASGDTLTLSTNYPGNTQVVVNGTLTATTTTFNLAGNGYGGDVLTVNSGGRLVASGSTFALNQVTLNAGSVFNPGDLSGDTFNGPLYLPITDVPLLSAAGGGSDNKSFQDIDILAGTLGTGTVNLNAIGTVSTASLRYVFPGNFTVAAGATLNVGPTVPVLLQGGQILTVNGAMTLASGDTLTLSTNYPGNTQVVVNGTLTATTTTFNLAGNGYGGDVLTVNSGGRLVASGSTFALNQVTLNAGSVFNPGDLSGDTFNGPLYLPITDVPLLSAAGGGSDNKSFQDIDILAGTLGTGTVNLNAIGTVSTASLRYVFPGNFTVAAGATLNVGPTGAGAAPGGPDSDGQRGDDAGQRGHADAQHQLPRQHAGRGQRHAHRHHDHLQTWRAMATAATS